MHTNFLFLLRSWPHSTHAYPSNSGAEPDKARSERRKLYLPGAQRSKQMNGKMILGVAATVLCTLYPQLSSAAKVLEYRFADAAATSAVDTSGNNLNGAFVGSDIHTDFSLMGHGFGVALNGVNDFINVGDPNLLDLRKYTLMGWIKYSPTSERNAELMEKAAAYWLNIRMDTRKVRAGGFLGPGCKYIYTDSPMSIPAGTWTHIASTLNGTQLKIFVNGQLAKTARVPGVACVNTNPLALSAKYVPTKNVKRNFIKGGLDDVRVFNNALTAAQIQSLMIQP